MREREGAVRTERVYRHYVEPNAIIEAGSPSSCSWASCVLARLMIARPYIFRRSRVVRQADLVKVRFERGRVRICTGDVAQGTPHHLGGGPGKSIRTYLRYSVMLGVDGIDIVMLGFEGARQMRPSGSAVRRDTAGTTYFDADPDPLRCEFARHGPDLCAVLSMRRRSRRWRWW